MGSVTAGGAPIVVRSCARTDSGCRLAVWRSVGGAGSPDIGLDIGQERRLRADDLAQRPPGADFVAPDRQVAGRAADPDDADQLVATDHDGQSAALRKIPTRNLADLGGAAVE